MNKDKNKEFSEPITRAGENKEFSEAIKERKKRILIRTKDEKGNWKEFNRENFLKESGYTGDLKDLKAVSSFMIAQIIATSKENISLAEEIERREKELKSLNSYDKSLTTAPLEKSKKYNSRYNKPDKDYTNPEVIKGVLALNLKEFSKGGNLGVETVKLIDNALVGLTGQTTFKGKNSLDLFKATIDIKEYLLSQGKEPTPEETKYLLRRVKNEYTPAIKSMYIIELRGKVKGSLQLISNILYDNKNIYVFFFPQYAEWLTSNGKIKHHAKCLNKLKEPDANAYYLGTELETYYGQDNNRRRNQYNKRSIQSLLKSCSKIPAEEEVKNSKARNCKTRIIKPFQKALETLVKRDFMTWEYVSNTPLNEEQQNQLDCKNITSFELFKKLYISYKLNNFPLDI